MGYLTDISYSSDSAKDVHLRTQNYVNKDYYIAATASQLAPQVLGSLTGLIGRCLNGSESDKTENSSAKTKDSEDIRRKELNKELSKALKNLGIDNISNLEEHVNKATNERNEKVKAAQEEVEKFNNGTDTFSTQIMSLKASLNNLNDENDPNSVQRNQINEQIKALETKREEALEQANNNLENVIKTEDAKLEKISEQVLEIQEIAKQLNALNFVGNTEETEKVKTQANELSSFNNAFDEFKKNPTKETALALQDAFLDCPEDSPYYRNYQKLYSLNLTKIEELIKS